MKVIKTNFEGLLVIEPMVFEDERGYFFEDYNKQEFENFGIRETFVQTSESKSKLGVLRGMHSQSFPHTQTKLVRVVKGKVLDVVVDLRKNSKTYKKWFSIELDEKSKKMLFVPKGFLHGFLSLEEGTILQYKFDEGYHPETSIGVRFDDPEIDIDWNLVKYGFKKERLLISEKDKNLPYLKDINFPF